MRKSVGCKITCSLFLLSILSLACCCTDSKLKDFKSDGCSMFPDSSFFSDTTWCECCYEHDLVYWRGGTKQERKTADMELKDCIISTTGSRMLARMMYIGVRCGGSPRFPMWYRWGYGWNYGRGYKSLTSEESDIVEEKIQAIADDYRETVCGCSEEGVSVRHDDTGSEESN